MNLTQGFQVAPAECFSCHNGDQRLWAVDMCADDPSVIKRFRVYFCQHCVAAAAKQLEPVLPWRIVSDVVVEELNEKAARADEWEARARRAEDLLSTLGEMVRESPPTAHLASRPG